MAAAISLSNMTRGWPLALLPAFYAAMVATFDAVHGEIVALALICAVLWLAAPVTRQILLLIYPAVLVIIAYDSLRYLRPLLVTPARTFGCELRQLEIALFSFGTGATLPDYFTLHHTPWVDLLFALPYAGFIYVAFAIGAVLFVIDRARLQLFIWSFAVMYIIAFIVWLAIPSAPPWYIQAHGCVIDAHAASSAAALLRVDQALEISYFESFYGRAPNPFAALPSLHNSYPMLGMLVLWPLLGWKGRLTSAVYVLWMMVASLYLDHHWVIDALAGWLTAALAVALAAALQRRLNEQASVTLPI